MEYLGILATFSQDRIILQDMAGRGGEGEIRMIKGRYKKKSSLPHGLPPPGRFEPRDKLPFKTFLILLFYKSFVDDSLRCFDGNEVNAGLQAGKLIGAGPRVIVRVDVEQIGRASCRERV